MERRRLGLDLREALEQQLKIQLLPKDAADERSAILEVRAGTGGDEAAHRGDRRSASDPDGESLRNVHDAFYLGAERSFAKMRLISRGGISEPSA